MLIGKTLLVCIILFLIFGVNKDDGCCCLLALLGMILCGVVVVV
jgi:hypothetical protein